MEGRLLNSWLGRQTNHNWVEQKLTATLTKVQKIKRAQEKMLETGNKTFSRTFFFHTLFILAVLGLHSEKAMASHSSTLAWKIPWTEEPGRLQSIIMMAFSTGGERLLHSELRQSGFLLQRLLYCGARAQSARVSVVALRGSAVAARRLVAPQHVESSRTRDQTSIGR